MTQLDGKSKDLVNENIEKLKEIFPEVFSEGKIDFSKLEEELGNFKEKSDERYNFTWSGKSEAKKIALTPSTGTLRPCKDESKDWDTTQNLYIEGDNLEVLKLLQKSYHKKVKMIYIDPPYNTGKDFVYKDNFRDNIKNYLEITGQVDSDGNKLSTNSETSGRYHSDWLNMMYPRLKLARNLLKDDGVIFISIDDNEVANLRKLCDEIFGEDNFVANSIWQSRTSISDDHEISMNHNHTIIYAKNHSLLKFYGDKLNASEYQNRDNDPRGDWKLVPLDANKPGGDTNYPILNPVTNVEYYPPEGRSWAINSKDYKVLFDDNRIAFGLNGDSSPKKKLFLKERLERGDTKTPSSILLNAGTTKDGSNELTEIFEKKKVFSYPKPTAFLTRMLQYGIYQEKNQIVLDFFSGSGTTAHSVFISNIQNEINTKFILVQLPENLDEVLKTAKDDSKTIIKNSIEFLNLIKKPHYLTEIGKERIRRAGEKVKSESGKDELDIGFKVLKLDSSNIKSWDSDFENLEANLLDAVENIKSDRNEEDLLYEILLKYGLDLTLPIEEKEVNGKKLYNIGFGALIICLDSNISIDITDEIIAIKKEYDSEITRVVFKDSGFKNATEKINIIKTLNQNGIDEVVSV